MIFFTANYLDKPIIPACSGESVLFYGEAMPRLAAYFMGELSARGKAVTLVDGACSFDPYLVARTGRHQRIAPRMLLERIRLSRAFTCHQLVTLLCEVLPGENRKDPLFVLGPCALFYDEQVALTERKILFRRVVSALNRLREGREGLYLFQRPISSRVQNRHFGRDLARAVDMVIRVRQGEHGLEGHIQHSLPSLRALSLCGEP